MATIMTLVDFSKGFNRIHHGILIEELIHLGVPGWIVRIVVSYLSERKLRIRYKEGVSEPADLPGGVGQGTIMGMWLFLIKMNNFGKQSNPGNGPRRPLCYTKKKWVDDLTEVNSIDLSSHTMRVPDDELVRPLNWHQRTGHEINNTNPAQTSLNNIYKLAEKSHMKVNPKKTQTMIFNSGRNINTEPNLISPNGETIHYVTKTKLLGVMINEKLNTWDNTYHIEGKAYKRIWILKRLKNLGYDLSQLIESIRSL